MVRPLRIEYPGALYHVTSRGNARANIFLDDRDRKVFLDTLSLTIKRYHWLCHSYCLMGNHYHLLIETPDGNLSSGMRELNGVYTQAFNRLHKRVGHVLQGRYKAFLVEQDTYLLEVARYVVLNPVRAGIVIHPKDWKWSSYRATIGQIVKPSWLTTDWILQQFHRLHKTAQQDYARFVVDGINKAGPFADMKEGVVLGFPQFIDWVRETYTPAKENKEVSRTERLVGRPTLEDLFSKEVLGDRPTRNEMMRLAHEKVGYSQREIADCVGLHYTWVSKIIAEKL